MVVVADEEEEWTGTESRGLAALGSVDAHFACGARFRATHVAQAPDVDRVQSLLLPVQVVLFLDQRHPPSSLFVAFVSPGPQGLSVSRARTKKTSDGTSRRALWRERRDILKLQLVDQLYSSIDGSIRSAFASATTSQRV